MRFNNFEEFCQHNGLVAENILPNVSMLPETHQSAVLSYTKLIYLTQALNAGWKPDWNNRSERKWFPWFDMEVDKNNPSGFRFDDSSFVCTYTYAAGGSRLCFPNEEDSNFAGKTWEGLFKDMMVLLK